jgi:hypothetical protein
MQSITDYIAEVNDTAEQLVQSMARVSADSVGLDARCGRLRINSDCIVVTKAQDRTMQYYGGFEYVDKDCRTELGDYVVYTADDGRVSRCIDTWEAANTNSPEEQETAQ